jgi:hypothetical protein
MKNIRIIFLTLILGSIFFATTASPVSISEAEKTAVKFYSQQKNIDSDISIAATKIYNSGNLDLIAVFTFNTDGFVAISLDSRFNPILAYSLTGSHNLSNFSVEIDKWFADIADGFQLEILADNNDGIIHKDWLLIENGDFPILSTKAALLPTPEWGQGCYYNTACPVDAMGSCGHSVTGCTATAMAMIMKYWNYPQYGIGEHSYETNLYGTQSANFGATEYLWGDIPATQPTEDNPALATIMFHCGVAVDMEYGTGTSGAYPSPAAFVDYFGYSQNARYDYLADYTLPEWVEILKTDIDNGKPVLYAGWEEMLIMGHSWVCDGYDASDYLHFNWGDNGSGNGYFLLPEIVFSENNMIVRNIFPASDCDIKVTQITAPFAHTFIGPATIKVMVENYSNGPLTDIPISYTVNNSVPVTETITESIESNGTYIFEFAMPFDFSQNPGMLYDVKVYSELACDTYRENDTASAQILNVSCASIPYSTDFEPGENTDGWLFEDANSDGRSWMLSYSGDPSVFYQGGAETAQDWLFSRCLELETGKLYKLSFDYKSTGMYWPQNLSISIGSGPESSLMAENLDEVTGFINDAFLEKEILFTVHTNDSYYLGFECFSDPDMLNLLLDNVNITELSEPDVELSEIIAPQSSCELGDEIIVVKVRNLSSGVISEIPISFILDGGAAVEEIIHAEILSGEFMTFQFETFGDFSSVGTHTLKVFTSMSGDNYLLNDTIEINIENREASYAPYLCEFETADEYEFYTVENLNDDNRTWQFISSGGNTNPGCVRYDYNDFEAANDLLITKCVFLEQQYAYKLSFWNKIEDQTWPENLKVSIGEIQTAAGMLTELGDYPDLSNSSWQENIVNFTVGYDGFYYLGFYCYSDAQMFNLYIDDISIFEDGLNNVFADNTNRLSIFPNPVNDILYLRCNDNSATGLTLGIYDMQGKLILETTMETCEKSINIESLQNGIYMIKLEGNNLLEQHRFVKL